MTKKKKSVALEQDKRQKRRMYTVVVPIFEVEQAEWTVRVALNLIRRRRGRVILVGMVLVPQNQPLSTGTVQAQACRALLDCLKDRFKDEPIYVKPRIRVEHEPWRSLVQIVSTEQAQLVVLPWPGEDTQSILALDLDELVTHLNCNVVIASGGYGLEQPNRILLPLRGSQEAPLAMEVALALAKTADGEITLLYAIEDDPNLTSQRIYDEIARTSQTDPNITQEVRVKGEVTPAILERAGEYDLIVMGASDPASGGEGFIIGNAARQLRQVQAAPFLIVKTYQPPPLAKLSDWGETHPLPATPTSIVVEKWFAENSFSSQEFGDLERLVAMKEEQQVTISLGLPALNEEATVGQIIETMQTTLMKKFPLLDEIVLIDSGSTDYTVDIAQEYRIPVYQHSEILPQYGTYRGKGEALWKSLYVLKGDLIAWIDTDIVNIHPRFVYGILGPLLRHDTIQYVKGFYRRPLRVGDTLQAGGGGRVTELVARPLFNLFYPELSGIIQPLSGEYAGRRTALEQMPFYIGYGVETGLLLNLLEKYGLRGIAQVDLRRRIHHNQPLGALSRMAFAIIQVFIDHLEQRKKVQLLSEMNRTMKIIRYEPGEFYLAEHAITDQRRPPIVTLPEYRERYHSITDRTLEETEWSEEEELL